jgi:hypothetical protein
LRKYLFVSPLLLIIAVIIIYFYQYREQNLGDLLDMGNVDKVQIITGDKKEFEMEMTIVDQDTLNKLADFITQYQVKQTNKKDYISNYENERFELYLGYKNGEIESYIFERDVVVSNGIYEVLNAHLDYQWIQEFASDFQ